MNLDPAPKRRHGRPEDLAPVDLDPSYTVAGDAIVGSPSDIEVVFIGPVGIGKTTAVHTLSTIPPVNTEAKATFDGDFYSNWKKTTTVGIDYGMWKPTPEYSVGLFGTAGQDRFQDARTALSNPEAGIVLWLYGIEDLVEEQLRDWDQIISQPTMRNRLCIGVNFVEENGPERLVAELEKLGYGEVPVVPADPRNRDEVEAVVRRVLSLLNLPGDF